MIRIEWKDNPESYAEYANFDEFYDSVKTWHLSNLKCKSAMQVILENYHFYVDGVRYEA